MRINRRWMSIEMCLYTHTRTHTHVLMSFGSGNFLRFYFNSQLSQFSYASSLLAPSLLPSANHHLSLTLTLSLSLSLTRALALYLCSHSLSVCVCRIYPMHCFADDNESIQRKQSSEWASKQYISLTRSLAFAACTVSLSLSHTVARLFRLACTARAMRGHPLALTNAVGRRQSSSDDDGDDARHISLCHIEPSGCGVRVWGRGSGG